MQINGIDGMEIPEIKNEIERGGRFVIFTYTISFIILTFKRPSEIYFIKHGENSTPYSIKYTLATVFLGWWGFPWGPIYSVMSLCANISGGKDVTKEVLGSFIQELNAGNPIQASQDVSSSDELLTLKTLAADQKKLLYGLLFSILTFFPILGMLIYIFAVPFQMWCIYKVGRYLKTPFLFMLMAAMILPIINIIIIVIINLKIIKKFKESGIDVGFCGIEPSKITLIPRGIA